MEADVWPSVSGNSLLPNQGSGSTRVRVEGAKSPQKGPGYLQKGILEIVTYTARILSSKYKMQELEQELKDLEWDV